MEKRKKPIKVVLFDWGGVNTTGLISRNFCATVGKKFHLPEGRVLRAFEVNNTKYLTGKIPGKRFFDLFAGQLGIRKDADLYLRLLEDAGKANGGALRLAKQLRKSHRLGLVSDNYKEMADFIEKKYRLRGVFDVLVFSNRIGIKKPDKRIFLLALKRLRVSPQEAAFIDDKEKNVLAARRLGIQAIRFTSQEKLKKQLAKLGIRGFA